MIFKSRHILRWRLPAVRDAGKDPGCHIVLPIHRRDGDMVAFFLTNMLHACLCARAAPQTLQESVTTCHHVTNSLAPNPTAGATGRPDANQFRPGTAQNLRNRMETVSSAPDGRKYPSGFVHSVRACPCRGVLNAPGGRDVAEPSRTQRTCPDRISFVRDHEPPTLMWEKSSSVSHHHVPSLVVSLFA